MTAEEVRAIVLSELSEQSVAPDSRGPVGSHCVDLSRCLLPIPERRSFADCSGKGSTIELWVVLDEAPGEDDGYWIVFDDRERVFGLALGPVEGGVLVGFYGTFWETLQSM